LIEADLLDTESEKVTRNIAQTGTAPIGLLTEIPKIYPIDKDEGAAVAIAAPPSLPNVGQSIRLRIDQRKKQLCFKLALLRGSSVMSAKPRLGIALL